jgi:hypothetical protein
MCAVSLAIKFFPEKLSLRIAAALLPALLGSGAGVIVLLSVLKLVYITDPHRRGRSIIVAGDDMDAGQFQ